VKKLLENVKIWIGFLSFGAISLFWLVELVSSLLLYHDSFYILVWLGIKGLPIFLGFLYCYSLLWPNRLDTVIDVSTKVFAFSIPALFFVTWNTQFSYWTQTALIEWSLALVLGYFLFKRKLNSVHAFVFSMLSMLTAGFLYEIPLFHISPSNFSMIHQLNLFWVPKGVIALILLTVLLYRHRWKPHKQLFLLALGGFIIFSVFYGINRFWFNQWIPRVPAILLMFSVALGQCEHTLKYTHNNKELKTNNAKIPEQ